MTHSFASVKLQIKVKGGKTGLQLWDILQIEYLVVWRGMWELFVKSRLRLSDCKGRIFVAISVLCQLAVLQSP